MKLFINKVMLFTLFVIALNIIYLGACMKWDWNFAKRIEAITLEKPRFEYIVLGNSLAMDGIDSEILGSDKKSTYNLAIGGASLKTNLIQLKDYLEIADKKPKAIILALGTYINNFRSKEINPIVEFTMKDYSYGLKDIPMIKFRWLNYELIKKIINTDHRKAKLNLGQLRIGRVVADNSKNANPLLSLPLQEYTESHYIKKIASLCQSSEIKLILIEMPGFKKTQNRTEIGPHTISIEGKKTIDLFNFNNVHFAAKFDPKSDWLGNSHLNKFGARKFTNYLKESIKIEKKVHSSVP